MSVPTEINSNKKNPKQQYFYITIEWSAEKKPFPRIASMPEVQVMDSCDDEDDEWQNFYLSQDLNYINGIQITFACEHVLDFGTHFPLPLPFTQLKTQNSHFCVR